MEGSHLHVAPRCWTSWTPPHPAPPLAPRGLRGLRPRGQEATPKGCIAVLVGEHVAAHKAGGASVPETRGRVRVQR
jgi:hypothetical protein